jgi:hypothetical protein
MYFAFSRGAIAAHRSKPYPFLAQTISWCKERVNDVTGG